MNAPENTHNRAVILVPVLANSRRDTSVRLDEAKGLALALGLEIAKARPAPVRKVRAATLFGKGVLETLRQELRDCSAGLLIVDATLTPVQQRNLERDLQVKVIDRTGVILEIFALRAKTKEGRLQVELARLSYERSRLVRTWTHLERQRGGRGFLAGPGERQLETDRRLLGERITRLRGKLEDVRRTRGLHRAARQRVPYPVIALVGYTNSGKSTLFNALSGSKMLAEDMLFATLDPAMRLIVLENGHDAILSDTVGFISNLPTELIAAFRATLEEVLEADIIVHVRDIACAQSTVQRAAVNAIMEQILSTQKGAIPVLEVWNKIDLIDENDLPLLQAQASSMTSKPVLLSAMTGQGLDALKQGINAILQRDNITVRIEVPASEGRVAPWICRNGKLISTHITEDGGQTLVAMLDYKNIGALESVFPALKPQRVRTEYS